MKVVFAVVVAISLAGGAALAEDAAPNEATEARLARIEQAIARLEQKLSPSEGGGMMERCREMMGAGMMDRGMMGGGMMRRRGNSSPNEQWRDPH